jgi:hypothetical protein
MNLIHEDLETPIHDLMDFLGVQFLGDGGIVRHVSKQDGYEFAFSLDGTPGREDLIGKILGSVGLGLRVVDGRMFRGFLEVMAAFIAEDISW